MDWIRQNGIQVPEDIRQRSRRSVRIQSSFLPHHGLNDLYLQVRCCAISKSLLVLCHRNGNFYEHTTSSINQLHKLTTLSTLKYAYHYEFLCCCSCSILRHSLCPIRCRPQLPFCSISHCRVGHQSPHPPSSGREGYCRSLQGQCANHLWVRSFGTLLIVQSVKCY
jgi:hypothetical protein